MHSFTSGSPFHCSVSNDLSAGLRSVRIDRDPMESSTFRQEHHSTSNQDNASSRAHHESRSQYNSSRHHHDKNHYASSSRHNHSDQSSRNNHQIRNVYSESPRPSETSRSHYAETNRHQNGDSRVSRQVCESSTGRGDEVSTREYRKYYQQSSRPSNHETIERAGDSRAYPRDADTWSERTIPIEKEQQQPVRPGRDQLDRGSRTTTLEKDPVGTSRTVRSHVTRTYESSQAYKG